MSRRKGGAGARARRAARRSELNRVGNHSVQATMPAEIELGKRESYAESLDATYARRFPTTRWEQAKVPSAKDRGRHRGKPRPQPLASKVRADVVPTSVIGAKPGMAMSLAKAGR